MRYFIITLFIASFNYAFAERTILTKNTGSVQLPPGYVNILNPGDFLRPSDAKNSIFIKKFDGGEERVSFDIIAKGKNAEGCLKYFPEQKKILTHWKSEINGHKVEVLVYEHIGSTNRGGAVVSYLDLEVDFGCDYIHQGHLANFFFIAFSYKPAAP